MGTNDDKSAVKFLRAVAQRWRERAAWSPSAEIVADEFDEAAAAIEAGEHARAAPSEAASA